MIYLFAIFGVLVFFVLIALFWLKALRLNHRLLLESEAFHQWYWQQDLSLNSYKSFCKKFLLVCTGLFWLAGFLFAAFNEGVAYSILVLLLGWFPAVALGFVVTVVLVILIQAVRCFVFGVRWLVHTQRYK